MATNDTPIVEAASEFASEAIQDPSIVLDVLVDKVIPYGLSINIGALALFLLGRLVIRILISVLKKNMVRHKVDEALISFVTSILSMVLLALVIIAALQMLGIATTSFVAIIGAAGLAIGLALQGSLTNFASGVLMIVFKPFRVGDVVDAAGVVGTVTHVEIFTTTFSTFDNKRVIVPNGAVMGGNITNYSSEETRRVDMVIGCGYGDDLKQVKQILNEMLAADERVLEKPAPTVGVSELGDSSINFVVRPWVKAADYWGVKFDFLEAVKERFDKEGISIPFPQQDVHLHYADKKDA